jgi:plastocyanin
MNHSREEKITSIAIIVIVAALALLGVVVMVTIKVTIPLQQEAVAQQQDNTTTTTTTQSIMPASSNKTFYVFSAEVAEGFNETAAGVAGDIYSLPVIVVNRGDDVTVHFYNTEETEETVERHSFTIDAQPYSENIDTAPGESGNATFTADEEGIFPYYCIYHLPTMNGQLVVLPPSSQGASSPPAT